MGSKEFRILNWVIFVSINLLLISESQGSSLPSSTVTTLNFESSPAISPKLSFVPLSVIPKASKDVKKKILPSPSISPTSVSKPANNESSTPFNAPSKGIDKLISPEIAPIPPEAKRSSNSSSASSPSISPVSNSNKTPPNAHSPSISSPSINPEPHKENSNSTSDNMLPPSPSSPESQNSSNANTLAPFPSIPKPLASSPHISPISNEANSPPNTTHSPLPTITSPAKSPISHEDANSSIITQAPSSSNTNSFTLSPTFSPTISTNSSIPLVSFPTISPTAHDIEKPTNSTHVPLASNISPIISPIPHIFNTHYPKKYPAYLHISPSTSLPSNDNISPLPSHIHPSPFNPVASPKPLEAKQSSNITHSPLLSSPPNPLETSPAISPIPDLVKVPSNATRIAPLLSPMPHEVNNVMNITREMAPIVSKAKHHAFAPLHHSPQSSQCQDADIPPSMSRINAIPPTSDRSEHSPWPHMHVPSITPVEAPSNLLVPPKDNHTDHPLSPKSQGSSSPSSIVTTLNFESSPAISPKLPFVLLGVAPKASKDVKKIIFPSPSVSPTSISKPANNESSTPINAPSKGIDKLISPAIAPTPPEAKRSSNSSSASSPSISPVSNSNKTPPNAHAPSVSSPSINPKPPKENSNSTSDNTIPPSPESQNSSNANTLAPFPSISKPLASSPHISPISNEANSPPNTTHSSLPTISSPAKSPVSHEDANSSIITQAPSTLNPNSFTLSPTLSPNIRTNSSIPLVSSPTISPTPHDIEKPTNSTHVPLASNISPIISPIPHVVNTHSPKNSPPYLHISPSTSLPSNDTISPLPSRIRPSPFTPMASPKPHEAKQSSNITHSPLLSSPPSSLETSPAISPIPHLVKIPSNATHVSPLLSPMPHEVNNTTNITHEMAPIVSKAKHHAFASLHHSPQGSQHQGAAIPPSIPRIHAIPPSSDRSEHSPSSHMHVPSVTPVEAPSILLVPPKDNHTDHPLSPKSQDYSISPTQAPSPSLHRDVAFAPSPSKVIPSWHNKYHVHPPPPPQTIWALPPPPPNIDCKFLSCQENVTYPPPGSLCVCVMPIKVELCVGISLFTFFPLVTELAQEIASGVFVKQSQVRVMGANADAEDPGKTILLIDLVPLGKSFDINTALLIYARFWHKQVPIKDSYFGGYDVLYVDYPGLPPSPPMVPGDVSVDGGSLTNGNARAIKPIGVDVKKNKEKISGTLIAIIVSSSMIALVISIGAAWILLLRCRNSYVQPQVSSHQSLLPLSKHSGSGPTILGSGRSSASLTSSIAAGSTKTFSLAEMERATNNFHELRIIGEGGFGRVYQGTLEDGTLVAVKVLKRDDHQGGREFIAEIEMLSRLHHRNLVKLIGICVEEIRCLVYELISNGSVESHLHGPDRITSPLDWNARIKIALGAARGLAYLHEDSSPRVIHRDFKSSNILLENDYTPKVSDFGLARVALGEGNDHISTCVMGTFGYVAPEYAMTGHLLVKSDVYSYGVVLLELLTGRKPVDMSQPPGQETLVNFARPLLTSTEGLKLLIDPSISSNVSLDTVAKVAAIASMCIQPEVSNRPYMGEVVQALKLVCDEGDEYMQCFSQDELCNSEIDVRISSELLLGGRERCFSSGPMRSENEWEKVRGFSSGSMVKNEDQWL